jgi:ABC-type branched-subunit amino acid transport system substrate-binding protein
MKWNISIGCLLIASAVLLGCDLKVSPRTTGKNGSKAAFVGGDGVFNQKFIEIGGSAAVGSYIITPYVNDVSDKAIKAFSEAFQKMHKKDPDAWAALTYDAVGTYAEIIGKVGPDRQKIRDGLAAMNSKETGYVGVTGVTYFDQNGDCVKPAIIATVEGNKFVKAKIQVSNVKSEGSAAVVKAGKKPTGEPIYIGVAGPFTGQSQAFGDMIRMGAELKIAQVNAAGGINGRPLAAKWGDDEAVNSKGANVAKDLASNPKIVAIVGHFNSTCSLAAKPVYTNNKIPMLSPGSTNVKVCAGSDYAFRNLYRDDFQGFLIADFIKNNLGKKKVVVFFDNDDYGKGLQGFFVKRAKEIGLEVAAVIPYNRESTTDYAPLVTKAKYKNPDAIFVAGLYEQAALIAKASKKAGILR